MGSVNDDDFTVAGRKPGAKELPDEGDDMVAVRRRHLDRRRLADDPSLHQSEPGRVARVQRVLFGHLDQPARPHVVPETTHAHRDHGPVAFPTGRVPLGGRLSWLDRGRRSAAHLTTTNSGFCSRMASSREAIPGGVPHRLRLVGGVTLVDDHPCEGNFV